MCIYSVEVFKEFVEFSAENSAVVTLVVADIDKNFVDDSALVVVLVTVVDVVELV